MKNNKDNNYLISCVSCILILLTICYFGLGYMIKETWAGFGGLSGCMNANIDLIYSPNYPDLMENPEFVTKKVCPSHLILNNMYDVPLGYEFVGWNTSNDGNGTLYYVGSVIKLDDNFTLYAQWRKKIILYGDLNIDNNIDEDDYFLLENHLGGLSILNDEILLSADVNGDSKVDEIDLDIIKHVNLETLGYTGYLPNEIVPIYSLYEDNNNDSDESEDVDEDNENNQDTVMGPGGGGYVSGNGNGTGVAGSGNSSTGTGGTNVKPNSGVNKPNGNSTNNNVENNIDNGEQQIFEEKTYKFKFIVGDLEYANTECNTGNYSSSCKLVLPNDEPIKKGYKFNGWSIENDCPSNVGINFTVLMEGDSTYYACFIKVDDNNLYTIVIVAFLILMIWGLSIFGIIYLIRRFKKTEIKD